VRDRGENTAFLPGFRLPAKLQVANELEPVLEGAEVVVVAVPSRFLRAVGEGAAPFVPRGAIVLSLAKGIEHGTGLRMTEVLGDLLGPDADNAIGVLTGPNLAREVMAGHPAATCVAFADLEPAEAVQRLLSSDTMRVYVSTDVIGCEIAGSVKNVIAIAAGVADGLGYGMNTRAALITRGLAELTRLGVALGGRPLTFLGLAGSGDLIATCSSTSSRNHQLGLALGAGRTVAQALEGTTAIAEGASVAPAVLELARTAGIEMPITEAVVALLDGQTSPADAVAALMSREPRAELDDLT
jgi:glycerol-3-phosphate dehydrogenase (NAD(P)+)